MFKPQHTLSATGFVASILGIGDLADRSVPLNHCDAAREFQPMTANELSTTRTRAAAAIQDKGPCWWNPPP
jgi:hypothetical protein